MPPWVIVLSALLTPTIAIAGLVIATRQSQTAEKVRKQQLFDRRFAVFEATCIFLGEVELHGKPSKDALRLYAIAITGAVFLFDDDLSKFLKEIVARAVSWQDNEARATRRPDGDEHGARLLDTANADEEWFSSNAPVSVLEGKFEKALKLD